MNSTVLLIGAVVLVLILLVVWARARTSRIRQEAEARERRAIAAVRAGGNPFDDDAAAPRPGESTGETIFEPGIPTGMVPGRSGSIEVAEVLDIDELLLGEDHGVASRARAQLEEPTNISLGDTLPPRPVAPVMAPAAPAAAPVAAARPAPPAPAVTAAAPAAAHAAPLRPAAAAAATADFAKPVPAAPAARGRPAAPTPAVPPDNEVPLRELVLAWFEARGYRSSPASPVVRPIERVLRHKDDPGRAYAFVVSTQRVTSEKVLQLAQQARGIGLIRLLVVADAGAADDAPTAKKGVRVLDRAALSSELARLDISVAAKIIAVARKRADAAARVL